MMHVVEIKVRGGSYQGDLAVLLVHLCHGCVDLVEEAVEGGARKSRVPVPPANGHNLCIIVTP